MSASLSVSPALSDKEQLEIAEQLYGQTNAAERIPGRYGG